MNGERKKRYIDCVICVTEFTWCYTNDMVVTCISVLSGFRSLLSEMVRPHYSRKLLVIIIKQAASNFLLLLFIHSFIHWIVNFDSRKFTMWTQTIFVFICFSQAIRLLYSYWYIFISVFSKQKYDFMCECVLLLWHKSMGINKKKYSVYINYMQIW